MRKLIVPLDTPRPDDGAGGEWLDLAAVAAAEVTSEEPGYPVEGALVKAAGAAGPGWRAAVPGRQRLRLRFDEPQRIGRVLLQVDEPGTGRTQELVLRWSPDGATFHELVRQQWTFSPGGSTREVEDYRVELTTVAALEVEIVPEIGGGEARASIAVLRVGQ